MHAILSLFPESLHSHLSFVSQGFPLIFHGVAGTDEREANCTSVYNMAEVEVLMEYLKALIDHLHKKGVTKIKPREIGIIAPYRKQVSMLLQQSMGALINLAMALQVSFAAISFQRLSAIQ